VKAHPQKFWFDENPGNIPQNPGKICINLSKMYENLRKIALCVVILQKWRRKSKCRRSFFLEVMFLQFFFGQVRGNLGKNGAWNALIWKNAPKMEWNAVLFLVLFSLEFFLGNLGNILRSPKNLPAPTSMFKAIGFQALNWLQKVGTGKASFAAKVV